MRTNVVGLHMEVTDPIRNHAEKKVKKLDKFDDLTQQIDIKFWKENSAQENYTVEISVDVVNHPAFIAKADMSLHRAEDQLTSMFVRRRAESLGHEIAGNYDHAKVMDWFRHQVPDMDVIERAVLRVARRSEAQLGHIWELAAKVMEADGTVLPEELDRLHALAQAVDHALSELRKGH